MRNRSNSENKHYVLCNFLLFSLRYWKGVVVLLIFNKFSRRLGLIASIEVSNLTGSLNVISPIFIGVGFSRGLSYHNFNGFMWAEAALDAVEKFELRE
jgi:hypothetical protein